LQGGGTLRPRLKERDAVRPGTLVARIDTPQGVVEVRSPVPGTLVRWLAAEGATVGSEHPLCVLSPDAQAAWEALRGLYLVGQPEDVPVVESFLRNSGDLPPNVAQQARLTLQAIQSRK
jgi:pyruvate/2-oxoglutarate dehydrogenase complex dihydrolipoamide acyltransferase (E2) component